MTRRHKPTMIRASRVDTQRADSHREEVRPVPTPREPSVPAAWEATSEPTAAKVPAHGKPPKGLRPPARVTKPAALSMFDEALRRTPDPEVKRRLRTAQGEMRAQISREIADLPPGADPSAYGY